MGIVAYGLSLAGYVASVRRLGAARTGMLFGTAPLFGLAGSAVFLGEALGLSSLGPAALILAGVALLGIERHPTAAGEGAAAADPRAAFAPPAGRVLSPTKRGVPWRSPS